MSIIGNNILAGASGNQGYEIQRSLRFNDSDSAYLNFTPGSAGNQKTWTWSAWIKRSASLGSHQHIFNPVNGGDGVNEATMRFDTSNRFEIYDSGTTRGNLITTQVFRDVSAWYHIVAALDTTQATASNRLKIYVNGQQVTAFDTETYPSQDTTWGWNGTQRHDLGRYAYGSSLYFDGYIAEVHFVDGTQLTPSNFGETNADTGEWIPKKYSGSHGSQGWYLNFSDNSGVTATTLGKDSSGNGNNWTPNNFSVTAGTGNDSLKDTPTNNWCTINPLDGPTSTTLTYTQGNLTSESTSTSARNMVNGTIGVTSGKWYWELTVDSGGRCIVGVALADATRNDYLGVDDSGWGIYQLNGDKYHNGTGTSYGSAWTTAGDVLQIALDADNSKIWFGKNGTYFASGDPAAGTNAAYTNVTGGALFPSVGDGSAGGVYKATYNFGQRAFDYTPPTGFKALNTANLPVPTVKDGTEYFNTVLWTGNSSTQAITGVGFQPDFVWAKARSVGYAHNLFDAVRGATKSLVSSSSAAEITLSGLTSFDSDGFSLGSAIDTNLTTHTYVGWNWKAGGSGSANTDGTISSTVSVNADAGFSVGTFSGTGSTGSIGHGLGVAPKWILIKNRDSGNSWAVYHDAVGANKQLLLNSTNAASSDTNGFPSAPTSTVINVGSGAAMDTNASGSHVFMAFAEVEGYSKFGSYTGNGSSSAGTFVFLPFKPALVIVKKTSGSDNWEMKDNTRDPENPVDSSLFPNAASAESTGRNIDFLSNGFRHYNANGSTNENGHTYIYMAFAETPFKYANAR